MTTVLKNPDMDLSADMLFASAALGGETSDKVTSAWTALGKVRSFAVLATVTNIANGQVVTLTVKTASDASGTGAATLTGTAGTSLTATGTATATDKLVLLHEYNGPLANGHTYVQAEISTNHAAGAEIVSAVLLRKLSA